MTPPDPLVARTQAALRAAATALDQDGDAVQVVAVGDGIASVRLGAVCASCPGSLPAVVAALEHELRGRVPEVEFLEAVP